MKQISEAAKLRLNTELGTSQFANVNVKIISRSVKRNMSAVRKGRVSNPSELLTWSRDHVLYTRLFHHVCVIIYFRNVKDAIK